MTRNLIQAPRRSPSLCTLILAACALFVATGAPAAPATALTIVQDGQPKAAIVLGDSLGANDSAAATLLAHIQRMSGASLPVLTAKEFSGARVDAGRIVAPEGKTPAQAEQYLNDLFHNVPVQDDKASAALQTFTGGKGDVLLAYEQDAPLAEQSGADIQIVYPPQTIQIQTPIATTVKASSAAKSFVKWMYTPQAQTILAQTGYRPVVSSVESAFTKAFPDAGNPTQFTIDDVDSGGWDDVMTKFFDPTNSVMQKIESSIGVSTSS